MSTQVADSLLAEALQTPWAITEAGLATVFAVLTRTSIPVEALERERGAPLSNDRNRLVTIRDGVAIIPVNGPLVRYGDWFSRISGATSYDRVSGDLSAAIENPGVKSILLQIESPGGEVTGVSDLAAMIAQANSKKKVHVHSDGMLASAAYWLAVAADRVVTSPSALIGSIGVRMAMSKRKPSDRDAVTTFEFVSSQSPKKTADPESDAGRAQIQAVIDDLGAVFVRAVAGYRGASEETVLTAFGQGDVFVAERALAAGMIDGIGTFEETLAQLASQNVTSAIRAGVPPATIHTSSRRSPGVSMKDEKEPGAADTGVPTQAALDAHATTMLAAERTRVTEILALGGVAVPTHVTAAISGATTVGEFAVTQLRAERAKVDAAAQADTEAKQAFVAGQKQNEATIAAAGVKVPVTKPSDEPDPRAANKGRLSASVARTGVGKVVPTSTAA